MGLDMFLTGKRYLWGQGNDTEVAQAISKLLPETMGKRVKEISVEAGYWRKANAIHAWFVKHVQGGTDDCGEYIVSNEQLEELRDLVKQVLADHSKAPELLPFQGGFFFGDTTYNEWYFNDLDETQAIIDSALAFGAGWDFYYQASW